MGTKDLIINKDYPKLKQVENGDYVFQGNIENEGNIIIELDDRFVISGSIKAGEGIEAGWGIKAGEGIEAGEGI
jgi:hypothetical protein